MSNARFGFRTRNGQISTFIQSTNALDADALAFINATGITNTTQINAIYSLVTSLKNYNLWDKLNAIYPFIGGTSTTCKYNLKDPRDLNLAYRLIFVGGWTFSANGALPNGTNAYADTKYIPFYQEIFDDEHLCFALNTNTTETSSDPGQIGAYNSNTQSSTMFINNSLTLGGRLNGNVISGTISTRIGVSIGVKTSATVTTFYKDGVQIATGNSGGTLSNAPIYIGTPWVFGGAYGSGYTKNQFTFVSMGKSLSATDVTNYTNTINNFNTALSR